MSQAVYGTIAKKEKTTSPATRKRPPSPYAMHRRLAHKGPSVTHAQAKIYRKILCLLLNNSRANPG